MDNGIDLGLVREVVEDVTKDRVVENVCFVGCGASSAELYPGYYFMKDEAKRLRPFHYTASEFNHDQPAWLGESTVVISASLGGTTPETVEANERAKAAGATVISLTHAPGSPLAETADNAIVHGFEANYAAKLEKLGYCLALAVELVEQVEGCAVYEAMQAGFERVFDLSEQAAHEARKLAADFGAAYADSPVVYVTSSGASLDVAYSTSICLMMEMQWVNSGHFHSGEFFHGPFEIVEEGVPFVLLMNDGKTRSVDARALTFLERFRAKVAVVDAKDYGLASAVAPEVITYFNPFVHTAVFRTYAEALAEARAHPLTLRRYMWKLEY